MGVLSYSGLLYENDNFENEIKSRFPKFFHGKNDEVIDAEYSMKAFERLKKLGFDIEVKLQDGLGHGIDENGLNYGLKKFIKYIIKFKFVIFSQYYTINNIMVLSSNNCPALVLNADYQPLSYYPLSTWSWKNALKAVFLERVNVVSQYNEVVRSPSVTLKLPSVVSLKDYIPLPEKKLLSQDLMFSQEISLDVSTA